MICYRCGCTLSEKDYCTGCGADVSTYKKILSLSNRYYNDALEKCSVRDLSGAVESLKQSIKLNKNNVDARNLLGLVYYELYEVIEATGQWVISKNIRDTKNIATDYIEDIQREPSRFENMNQNLRKFNIALQYCYRDSLDYAVVQLKNILSSAPKYVKARQLLALIYIVSEEWSLAQKQLEKCLEIDTRNTITLRYLQEIESITAPIDEHHVKKKKQKDDGADNGVYRYQSGNETIIQPINKRESKGAMALLYVFLGALVGACVVYFLVLPSKIYSINEQANEKVQVISDEKDKKSSELDALSRDYSSLEAQNKDLLLALSEYEGTEGSVSSSDALMNAVLAYLNNPEKIEDIAQPLEMLEPNPGEEDEIRSEAFNTLYDELISRVRSKLAQYYYEKGYQSYKSEDFETAIPDLKRAYNYDAENGDALFYLGNSYRKVLDDNSAKEIYAQVIEEFPGSERAAKAQTYLAEINNQE